MGFDDSVPRQAEDDAPKSSAYFNGGFSKSASSSSFGEMIDLAEFCQENIGHLVAGDGEHQQRSPPQIVEQKVIYTNIFYLKLFTYY